jgi:dihydrofolate reductase
MRSIILYIASSLDGYIADSKNSLDWLTAYHGDYGYTTFMNSVDTVLMGRKTYDWVTAQGMSNPHPEQIQYVFTSTPEKYASAKNTIFTSADPIETAKELQTQKGKNIFLVGGGVLIREFLKSNMVDEFILFFVPIVLGSGIRLFEPFGSSVLLETISATKYDDGMMELRLKKLTNTGNVKNYDNRYTPSRNERL